MKSESAETVFVSPKWEAKPKLHRYPTKRWGHTAVIHKSKLYIYGGKTGKAKEPLYEIDCDTFQSHILQSHGLPESRESHSCSLIRDKLIIWGGCHNNKLMTFSFQLTNIQALNDCLSLQVKDRICEWAWIPQFPKLKERESHATTVFKEQYILLYGGCNDQEIYDDFWVFNSELEIWFEIKSVVGKMRSRENCTLNVIRNTIYMFGGEFQDGTYESSLHALSFSFWHFKCPDRIPELQCELVCSKGRSPPPRSSHTAVAYEDRFLIVIGGQGSGIVKGKQSAVLFNDVWAYDSVNNQWSEIQVLNRLLFKPRSCFTASVYRKKIFIFGGLTSIQNFRSSDELLVLSLSDSMDRSIEMCNICKLHYSPLLVEPGRKDIVDIELHNSFNFGLGSLYKLARSIRNPFDALTLLVDGYSRMGYGKVRVDLIQGRILMLQGSEFYLPEKGFEVILKKYEFADDTVPGDPRVSEAIRQQLVSRSLTIFAMNIKNGCARLGHNFVFLNRRSSLIDIMLVSPDNLFYCEVDAEDYSVGERQSRSYEVIRNFLNNNNLNITLLADETFTIAITGLRKGVNGSELKEGIRLRTVGNQIGVADRGHRADGDKHLGITDRDINPREDQLSFQSHMSTYFLQQPDTELLINNRKVDFRNLEHQMESVEEYHSLLPHDFLRVKLKENAFNNDSVILLYRNKLQVGKYRYRSPTVTLEGYVEVPAIYQLNITRSRLEHSHRVVQLLQQICQQFSNSSGKRAPPVSLQQLHNNH